MQRDDERDEEGEKQAADDLQSQLENIQQQIVADADVIENKGEHAAELDGDQGVLKSQADLNHKSLQIA